MEYSDGFLPSQSSINTPDTSPEIEKAAPIVGEDSHQNLRKKMLNRVDKTEFLYKIISNEEIHTSFITLPPGWGKSTMLDTFETFLGANITPEGTIDTATDRDFFFEMMPIANEQSQDKELPRFYIGAYPETKEMMGQYPVVHLKFCKKVNPSFDELREYLSKSVKQVYLSHKYLAQSPKISSDDQASFRRFIDCEVLTDELIVESLKFLIIIIQKHFERKVVVLIDDYDEIFIHCKIDNKSEQYFQGFENRIITMFKRLFIVGVHIFKAVLASKSIIIQNKISNLNSTCCCFNAMDISIFRYFGFTYDEKDQFCSFFDLPPHIVNLFDALQDPNFDEHFYILKPCDVLKCINDYQELLSPIELDKFISFPIIQTMRNEKLQKIAKKFITMNSVEKLLQDLVMDYSIPFTPSNFNEKELYSFLVKYQKNSKEDTDVASYVANWMTKATFTVTQKLGFSLPSKEFINIRNEEARLQIVGFMRAYYFDKHKLKFKDIEEVIKALETLKKEKISTDFYNKACIFSITFSKLFQKLCKLGQETIIYMNGTKYYDSEGVSLAFRRLLILVLIYTSNIGLCTFNRYNMHSSYSLNIFDEVTQRVLWFKWDYDKEDKNEENDYSFPTIGKFIAHQDSTFSFIKIFMQIDLDHMAIVDTTVKVLQ